MTAFSSLKLSPTSGHRGLDSSFGEGKQKTHTCLEASVVE